MACRYCFYRDEASQRELSDYGIMDSTSMRAIIDKTLSLYQTGGVITYVFQGGEPTCAGLPFFKAFIAYVNRKKKAETQINYSLQTNGLLLNDEWMAFLKENSFLVGISCDGPEALNDQLRLTTTGKGTYRQVMETVQRLKAADITFNVLSVITEQTTQMAEQYWAWVLANGFDYLQPVYCLPPFNGNSPYALKPHSFFKFNQTILPLWIKELKAGHYISYALYDNLVLQLCGFPSQQCGGQGTCSLQYVIESDGSVYPCDFYALDEYKMGNINQESMMELSSSPNAHRFISQPHRFCSACENCKFMGLCRRQCKRLNICYYDDHYCGYQDFLEHNITLLEQIAQDISSGKILLTQPKKGADK
jgi:uncharacterized protein